MFVDGDQSFPVEVWQLCWESVPAQASLAALSQTCRLFHDICQPLIFHRVAYSLQPNLGSQEAYQAWKAKTIYFEDRVKWLAAHPRLSKFPRECSFYGTLMLSLTIIDSEHPTTSEVYLSILSTLKKFIPSFIGLRSVLFTHTDIDEDILGALASLPFLTKTEFYEASFTCVKITPLLTPKDLTINYWQVQTVTPSLEVFSNELLESLRLCSFQPGPLSFERFIKQGPSNFLTSLHVSIHVQTLPTLFTFLEMCPRLESLTMEPPYDSLLSYPPLPLSALRRLQYFSGPAAAASIIIPLRPVTRVIIDDRDWNCSIKEEKVLLALSMLLKSTATIQSLYLPNLTPHPDVFHVIHKLFPALHTLVLSFKPTQADVIGEFHTPDEVQEYFSMGTYGEVVPIEVDEQGNFKRSPESIKGLLDCLRTNKISLPLSIEHLTILFDRDRRDYQPFMTFLSVREQLSIVIDLSKRYPKLKQLSLDSGHLKWTKEEPASLWKPTKHYKLYLDGKIWNHSTELHISLQPA
ncbi:hypothetical protein GALMADRAFT_256176 [Galerina marginata CBS 339.88]|uniref:F-box domain-containing protein n=1 Tax=Galerina marginata (strain CBS 339.88) TaxID=685588 RepID=A0A067SEH1_GALM3|nr:hypothetical protein GALMADRAFT_256176 [Galerina marginata CBS 339.88]